MSADDSGEQHVRLEAARVALAAIFRAVSLEIEAQALESLPPVGVEGWAPTWLRGLGFAKAAAERWRVTVSAFGERADDPKEREGFDQLRRDLAAVEHVTAALITALTRPRTAHTLASSKGPLV